MKKFRNCPFCGSSDIRAGYYRIVPEATVECQNCGASNCETLPKAALNYTEDELTLEAYDIALKLWNRREKGKKK